jgi:ABC-type branched-subunit amino acid transport system substrate-binding protein
MSGDLLMASASNLKTVWNPSINSAFTVSFAQGSYFAYSLPLYARNSAKTVISFCGLSSGSNVTLCTVYDLNQLNQSAIDNGMELVDYVSIDLDSSTYIDDMQNAVDTARSEDVDVVVVNDYSKLCIDIVNYMREINWTPKGLNFVDCIYNSATREAIGEPYIQHSVSQTSFFGEGNYTSGTSGYTPAQLNNLFKLYSGRDIDMDGANAFAAGEIMQAAIEVQAARNASLVTDPAVLSDIIKNGSWSTVLSPGNIIFDASHIADYDITITQFATNFELVRLEDHETLVYPMPSWMSRECERSTQSCSGHGFCVDESCICEANYYDSSSALKCDSKCHGVIVEGVCRSNRDYYVGVNFYFDTSNFLELEAHARLAIELVNDKSNEWFSNITQQVTIIPRLNNSACDPDTARLALTDQENWVKQISNGTHELDGVIGAFCSSASAAIASQGARKSLPQISPISTLLSLGDKELYPYFSRTCPDNGHNSDALVNVFEDLGLNPYITIVFDITDNAKDFANSVAKE